jgi:hypothetical protein
MAQNNMHLAASFGVDYRRPACPFDVCSVTHNEAQDCSQDFGPFDPNGAQMDGDTEEFERLNFVEVK